MWILQELLQARPALLVVFVFLSCGMFTADHTPVWMCVCPLSSIKGTLTRGCHFAFLCSRARIAVYCHAPDSSSLNLALALV